MKTPPKIALESPHNKIVNVDIGPLAHTEVKAVVDEFGLTICITHVGFDYLQHDTEAAIAQHKLWGCPNVAVGSMPGKYRGSEKGFRQFAKDAVEVR